MDSLTQNAQDQQSEQRIALLTAKVAELSESNRSLMNTQMLVEAMLHNIPDRIYFKDAQSRFVKISKDHGGRSNVPEVVKALGEVK